MLKIAHHQSGPSFSISQNEIEFRNNDFGGEEKTEVSTEELLRDKRENQQQNQPKYDVIHRDPNTEHIRECFHQCATLALQSERPPFWCFP